MANAGKNNILDFGGLGALQIGNSSNGGNPWTYANLMSIPNLTIKIMGAAPTGPGSFSFSQVTVDTYAYTQISLIVPTSSATWTSADAIGVWLVCGWCETVVLMPVGYGDLFDEFLPDCRA